MLKDTELFRTESVAIVEEGDILIRNGAGFDDILNVLVKHANDYMLGYYSKEDIVDALYAHMK